nr:Chain B, GLY-GLY-GLY-THR-SER-VAL [Homo sapiens]
GGGTSV